MTLDDKPAVTVVIPCYNHESYIGEALESVLASTVQDFEIVVVDDGSRDGCVAAVKRIKDPRIRLVEQSNHGAHHAINRGVEMAGSEWIAILNSDDRFHPRKLERHLDVHAGNPDIEASASRVRYVSDTGAPFRDDSYLVWRYGKAKEVYSRHGSLFESLLVTNHLITTSGLFVKREVFLELGGFIPLRYVHDWFMFLALAARGRFLILEEDLVDYRRHPANTITENDTRGRVEDNFVLEWTLFRLFSSVTPVMKPHEALSILAENNRVSYKLMVLFQMWRQYNGNDLARASAIFQDPNHPLIRRALDLAGEDRGSVSPKRLLRRLLGNNYMRLADLMVKGKRLFRSL